jgi:hypothetical protein
MASATATVISKWYQMMIDVKNRWAAMLCGVKGSNARTRIDIDRTKADLTDW